MALFFDMVASSTRFLYLFVLIVSVSHCLCFETEFRCIRSVKTFIRFNLCKSWSKSSNHYIWFSVPMSDASDASFFFDVATSNINNITVSSLKQLQQMITE